MKFTYKQRLTLSFLAIFVAFTAGVVLYEQHRAKKFKTEALEEKLEAYADMIEAGIQNGTTREQVDFERLMEILPQGLRLTYIAPDGQVGYDNLFENPSLLGNHAQRPEIVEAKEKGSVSYIRTSVSTGEPYLYFAKYYGNGFIRVAMPYDIKVQHMLEPDNGFLYFILTLFVIGFLLMHYVGGKFGNSIRRLRDFSLSASKEDEIIQIPDFPKDELGEIGGQLVKDYKKLKDSQTTLLIEKEKLLLHVQSSAEGICFFNPDRSVAFYNGLFIQYMNVLDDDILHDNQILESDVFDAVRQFIGTKDSENYFEQILKQGQREFLVRINKFEDGGFEIILNDITKQEKTRRLKKEMTGNIAHELRTPVTSIRGFLETLLETPLPAEQHHKFLEKAYLQTLTLSDLIRDIGMLTKIEDRPESFDFKPVRLTPLIGCVQEELQEGLKREHISIESFLSEQLDVSGNASLLYSIFRNLTENAIKHAGSNITIEIREIGRKNGLVYFSFADNGKGIADEGQLFRLFERFYRADEGRTRETGGSGLGLSIVKNAVLIHGGNIHVKNRKNGGLEFIFSLKSV